TRYRATYIMCSFTNLRLFFLNDTATTEIYTLSLHDALPICKLDDERFRKYGKTAPKSKADFAFVEHMLAHLNATGTMAVVLPHGVLFRGAAEGIIRRYMIEQDNVLDAVIGLPANLFYGTSIPTTVLVFNKNL